MTSSGGTHRRPAARARRPRGRASGVPQRLEVTLDGLRQLHRRLEQRQPESSDWPLVCALVWNQIVRAEGRQERMASKITAAAAAKDAREAGCDARESSPGAESTSSSSSSSTNATGN